MFFTPSGISAGYEHLAGYAKSYKMNILMSNYCGHSFGVDAAGQSGFWNNDGELISNLDETETGLLLVGKNDNNWTGNTIKTEQHLSEKRSN